MGWWYPHGNLVGNKNIALKKIATSEGKGKKPGREWYKDQYPLCVPWRERYRSSQRGKAIWLKRKIFCTAQVVMHYGCFSCLRLPQTSLATLGKLEASKVACVDCLIIFFCNLMWSTSIRPLLANWDMYVPCMGKIENCICAMLMPDYRPACNWADFGKRKI